MTRENQYDAIDCAKLILSFFVVGIHTLGRYGVYPLFRIAVPVFFLISSYLFFTKVDMSLNGRKNLELFCKRNLKLYCFWAILLFPFWGITYITNKKIIHSVLLLCIRFFFGSTFPASWYIMSLVIGTFIVFELRNILNRKIRIILILFIYIVNCLASNYRGLFSEESLFIKLVYLYPGTIYNSVPISIVWIGVGELIASSNQESFLNNLKTNTKFFWLFLSLIILVLEAVLIERIGCCVDNDCYFMLLPVCVLLFNILLSAKIKIKNAVLFRKLSTIIYCTHGIIAVGLIRGGIANKTVYEAWLLFVLTVLISSCISILILNLEKHKIFRWLRYAY